MSPVYVHFGCGPKAPEEWINFDVSPSLFIQNLPIIGYFYKRHNKIIFPENVRYGNIVKGLPVRADSCDGLYCSHVLEHLSLHDFRQALINSHRILKKGGVFRIVVPDLQLAARSYIQQLDSGDRLASLAFMQATHLGIKHKPKGMEGVIRNIFGNSHHLWMWDDQSLSYELEQAGFKSIRLCSYLDSADPMFAMVEEKHRFENAVAVECVK
jgi:predicted SAM-dependent methyltransferase